MVDSVRILVAFTLVALGLSAALADDEFAAERQALTQELAALARDTAGETGRPAFDPRVMSVVATVPRDRFVPAGEVRAAYQNRPLPIGYGQTISQPYIVGLVTDLLRVEGPDVGIEI